MGKKKVQNNPTSFVTGSDQINRKGEKLQKGKKTYLLSTDKSCKEDDSLDVLKVQIPEHLEQKLIELILKEQKSTKNLGDVSKRITVKKLTNVYNSLSDAGFTKDLIEAAMVATITSGGDLLDALDWICLNTQNDQLPVGFSETLHQEEEKLRPKFNLAFQVDMTNAQNAASSRVAKSEKVCVKNWILDYAEKSSDEEVEEEEIEFDPTARFAVLQKEIQDLKDEAAIAKSNNNTEQHQKLSKALRAMHLEMSALEKHPDFDKSVKSQQKLTPKVVVKKEKRKKEDEESAGFNLFNQIEASANEELAGSETPAANEEFRTFEYTRSQWTGKSPKQFLIDWVRKHLPKSGPPKFTKIQVKFNRFKSTVTVDRQKDGILSVTPDILCDNIKDSEHLAATLALYQLCHGQPVHQLLPPPYRNIWMDWADGEKKVKEEAVQIENKPRDQFITKLMKRMNLEDMTSKSTKETTGSAHEMEEDDWETLADKGQLPDIPSDQTHPTKQVTTTSAIVHLQKALLKKQATLEFQDLLQSRKMLPVFQYKDQIMSAIRENSVVIIASETGSGKSTQIPQFVLEDSLQRGLGNVYIVCTQPRRISAVSLATRVSCEMGEKNCHPSEALVGYQIRFESKKGPNTKLLYCTTGVVLRQLQTDADLKGFTHVIVDEVHERSVQSDYLLIVVKEILSRRSDLKVILMSATMDSDKFSAYFHHCPVVNIPGKTYPVQISYLEDVVEKTGYVVDEDSPYTLNPKYLVQEAEASVDVTQRKGESTKQLLSWTTEDVSKIDRTQLSAEEYSLRTRNAISRLNLDRINLDLILDLLTHIDTSPLYYDIDGAVLIFLPGYSDIQELLDMLTSSRHFSNSTKYQIYALHSCLTSHDQAKVFSVPPPGVRKIILATNIAETGITIPDVVYVIDSGKAKEYSYMENSRMSSLEEIFISKANCKQRAGRAGRVREGHCFRLYTREQFEQLKAYTTPELLRVPLESLCLNIMKCQFGKPQEFLSGALDPPQSLPVSRAMSLLKELGACQLDETSLTPLGHHLAALPVDVRIGKMLLLGSIFGCLEAIAIIAAAMTEKSPFVSPFDKRSEADLAKQSLAVACSDHITLYKTFLGWCKSKQEGRSAENAYISKYFLKKSSLLEIENVKNDLIKLVADIGFNIETRAKSSHNASPRSQSVTKSDAVDNETVALIKAVLTAGFYPQVGQIITSPPPDVSEKCVCLVKTAQGLAQIHPSSVNRNLASFGSWMVFHEKVKASNILLKTTTVISPYNLLLFGGSIDVQHLSQIISLDGWIKFKTVAKTGVIFKELRLLLNNLLNRKLQEPNLNISDVSLIPLLKDLLRSEKVK